MEKFRDYEFKVDFGPKDPREVEELKEPIVDKRRNKLIQDLENDFVSRECFNEMRDKWANIFDELYNDYKEIVRENVKDYLRVQSELTELKREYNRVEKKLGSVTKAEKALQNYISRLSSERDLAVNEKYELVKEIERLKKIYKDLLYMGK